MNSLEQQTPPASLARAIVRSLTRGTTIKEGVRFIHVGQDNWIAAQKELLNEIAEDGHSDTKFVRGAYGSGKTHFLSMVQEFAQTTGWTTSHVECSVDGVQIDRFETLYPRVVAHLCSADMKGNDPLDFLLSKWATQRMKDAGLAQATSAKPYDADRRLYGQLQRALLRNSLQPNFLRALIIFARAFLVQDAESIVTTLEWFRGSQEKARLPATYLQKPASGLVPRERGTVELKPIGRGTAHEAMASLLWLIKSSGYSGLVLCIDEIEELAKLSNRRRQDQALQALREFVDHAGGEGGFTNMCLYLAATPEMFEGPKYFPRYDALATRIQPLGPDINWRAPVIDLDKTPLDDDLMLEMGNRIRKVYESAYGELATRVPENFIGQIVGELGRVRFRVAKPRLLARVLIDELERARQASEHYVPGTGIANLVQTTALKLAEEAG